MAKNTEAVVSWDKELAEQAVVATKQMEGLSSGQFISVKAGQITIDGAPVNGNQLALVISAHVHEHAYYEGDYDPENPASPVCFAFGTDPMTMAPHEKSLKPQAKGCAKCEWNQFGSASKGKGKACKNVMRIGVLSGGSFDSSGKFLPNKDPSSYEAMAPRFYRIPVTSVRGYAGYVTNVATITKRPVFAVFTKMKPIPDAKSQFKITFELIDVCPNEIMPALMARHKELESTIGFPYMAVESEAPAAKGKVKGKSKFDR